MKELSIKEKAKAKAYDEVLEKARKLYNDEETSVDVKNACENIFPELKESYDEKIRKAIIGFFELQDDNTTYFFISKNDILAWLEKQGEQKSTDKVEPKFKIEKDKWYVCTKDLLDKYGTRAFCKGSKYYSTKDETLLPDNSNIPFEIKYCVNDYFRLWTIADAKDGDVLAFDNNIIVIFKDLYNKTTFHSYCHIEDGVFSISEKDVPDWWNGEGFKPAAKEQCNTLFAKMKEAGYKWDEVKKELNNEDEKMLIKLIGVLDGTNKEDYHEGWEYIFLPWLKSLKERIVH